MGDEIILIDDEDDIAKDAVKMLRKIYQINKNILANGGYRTEKYTIN